MALDRDSALKKAEKLLRQGRLDAAITEYVRVVEEYPRDWSTANTLGELYARAGQSAKAVEQYTRIAEHFVQEGFYPKAAALYKKILKSDPQDEATQLRLAEISAMQGLLADAKSHLNAIAARRRIRGDRRGAAEIVVRLGTIDPADFDARLTAARTLEEMGEEEQAGDRFKALYQDLVEKGRLTEALDALREFVRLNPLDSEARATLAKSALNRGDFAEAREFLDPASAGADPQLLMPLVEIELRAGEIERARSLLARVGPGDAGSRRSLVELGWSFVDANPDSTFVVVDSAVDAAIVSAEFGEAASMLQEFVNRVPGQIPALLKLVEVCVDGGLELEMYAAQERLADAYLSSGQAAEARVIAEDLVAREPWEPEHIDRFRRALVMLRVSDPDTLIAERLSGQAPFMARDLFFDPSEVSQPSTVAPAESAVPTPEDAAEGQTPVSAQQTETTPPEVSQAGAIAGTPTPPKPHSAPGDEIDLTGELGELKVVAPTSAEGTPGTLDHVFADMRNKAEADPDYSAQHMILARTYLEIGMVQEAMTSLQNAARSPRQRFEAATALGRLYNREGDTSRAIEWLERAAEAPAPTVDEGRALLYDLGVLLDGSGETSRALAVFLELQADAGDYRDVPARIDRLARVQTGG